MSKSWMGSTFAILIVSITFASSHATAPTDYLHIDYCVIGAGPGGLQMAYFLQQSQRHYLVFERSNLSGSFFVRYPRHRKLISINKQYTGKQNKEFNLRHDWNSLLSHDDNLLYKHYTKDFFPHADTMVHYLNNFTNRFDLKVRYNTEIMWIEAEKHPEAWNGHYFFLTDQNDYHYRCSVLLVATGMWVPNKPDFPGSEHVEGYESISVDPANFVGQTVLILGRGNAAFETADNIVGVTNFIHMLGRSRLRLAWATHYVGDVRAVNNAMLDTYQLKSLDGLLEGDLANIAIVQDRKGKLHLRLRFHFNRNNASQDVLNDQRLLSVDEADNFSVRQPYDRVIRCLGWNFDFSIFNNLTKPQRGRGRTNKYPLIKATYESGNLPGMFIIGTAGHSIDYRKSAGGFIHGFRYTARAVHHLLEHRYHGTSWPATTLPISHLTNTIIKRINEASGLYQMFSILADIVLLQKNATEFEYLEEYPIGALPHLQENTGRNAANGLFVINLEYGSNFSRPEADVFHPSRSVGEPRYAWLSNFLHPVIYFYKRLPTETEMTQRPKLWPLPRPYYIHHVVEDFLTDWTAAKAHILPLRRFLENCLDTDLRSFFAESCFKFALTNPHVPPFCRHGYLNKQGLLDVEIF
ncbi:FAD-dependent oxidoreductase domain-containing protein 2 isoform X1 [Chiloscyllium plagiosum]|uniref:FAD-dependent oxidoreductase domain-containing protein 2 isoform X1 n=1 Tax=Chiloscyllium plagiosum TaxID=36176 RepID=UPI001CB7DFDF|nr:FAD-dependent oxidoreductase domain-containing protein 2 isoform X1 [Chiloscyllium plagiosum]XP_043535911.1 FAD-dependent oxidoreductase domain-containing protein 2 isoform X1 [Chiloscyllium plagiosum]XP_043535912.1 FAD-dependent oxidoreductase domain-containing protein 2 isoform X1 [Chiloscyllium plagiosum]XP_043535913.1 FAD-dependent oxidoreductase domain-containing protein 2 isoform X1 [Chiloscyllium plagiosum]XP_043535914.1 FAD-dependent oxidoreductase domain-containing protein 2 isoform